jgi:hypothetical protein
VIRNAVIHILNEQPLLGDLYALPAASDAGLVCTNLRSTDGKRPTFIDQSGSTFFFPYLMIRFVEIPEGAMGRHAAEGGRGDGAAAFAASAEDPAHWLPAVVTPSDEERDEPLEPDLEIDEDFLQRIRDI